MANCNLFQGIASISGKMGNVIFKTFTRRDGTSFTRVYSSEGHKQRCTPPSDREKAQRTRFAAICRAVAQRQRNGDTRPKKLIWDELAKSIQ